VTGTLPPKDGQGPALPATTADGPCPAPADPAPVLVERATALRGLSISAPRKKKSALRKQTELDLHGRDPEVPCLKAENVIRDLVCSLMERQDRMNEAILNKIVDLEYRVKDIEIDFQDPRARGRS